MPTTAVRSTKKPAKPAKKLAKKTTGKYVVYGTAGGMQGNIAPEGDGFNWFVKEPKIYPSPAAVRRAINKANRLADASGIGADTHVAPARMIEHRDGTVTYKVVE